jgi:hypothetical protein
MDRERVMPGFTCSRDIASELIMRTVRQSEDQGVENVFGVERSDNWKLLYRVDTDDITTVEDSRTWQNSVSYMSYEAVSISLSQD